VVRTITNKHLLGEVTLSFINGSYVIRLDDVAPRCRSNMWGKKLVV